MAKRLSLYMVPVMALLIVGCTSTKEGKQHVKTPSGLEITTNKEGSGAQAHRGDTVKVDYTGWLRNADGSKGLKFDSSVDRGIPFGFKLGIGSVIKGWEEGVEGMKVGEERTLVIPANLGYGSRGAGALIPGNATLIFDVKLLKIN